MTVSIRLARLLVVGVALMALIAGALPAAAHTTSNCSVTASMDVDTAANKHRVKGTGSCSTAWGSARLDCKPIHRHSLSWHDHDGDNIFNTKTGGSSISTPAGGGWGPWVTGTNGDDYKARCELDVTHSDGSFSNMADESPVFTL